ncbi:MAG: hypothetical protein HY319_31970 [Armatimonadetes bacterium]|nr:hypothetical protein [Armatimonadota bacterium]
MAVLEVVEVRGREQLRQFLDLPGAIYPLDSRWVAPLRLHVRSMMGRLTGPDRGYWLALYRGWPVARLGARLHHYRDQEAIHFGFLECRREHPEALRLLVQAAHGLAPALAMRGPYHFTQEDPYPGVLVDGFQENPSLMMSYNPRYYAEYLEQAGLRPLADLYSYELVRGKIRMDLMEGRARRAREQGVAVRTMDPWGRLADMRRIIAMANRTHADNRGFEEYAGHQALELLLMGILLLDPGCVFLAFQEDRPAGFVVIVPDVNPLLKPSRGRFGPALILRLLFGRKSIDRYRAYGMGVLAENRNSGVAAALVQAVMEAFQSSRYHAVPVVEVAWTLADNRPMNAMVVALGGRRCKVHRVYEQAAT